MFKNVSWARRGPGLKTSYHNVLNCQNGAVTRKQNITIGQASKDDAVSIANSSLAYLFNGWWWTVAITPWRWGKIITNYSGLKNTCHHRIWSLQTEKWAMFLHVVKATNSNPAGQLKILRMTWVKSFQRKRSLLAQCFSSPGRSRNEVAGLAGKIRRFSESLRCSTWAGGLVLPKMPWLCKKSNSEEITRNH